MENENTSSMIYLAVTTATVVLFSIAYNIFNNKEMIYEHYE